MRDMRNEMRTRIVDIETFRTIFVRQILGQGSVSPWLGILFAGDRMDCCDEAAVVEDCAGRVLACGTIAPFGEGGGDGMPTIVGVYVMPIARRQGTGVLVTQAAIDRCIARGFEQIRMDVMSTGMMRIVNKLDPDRRARLVVYDSSQFMPFDFD